MSSIFSKIVLGEIPCYKVAEDDNHVAFLDIFPMQKGHTLVIPKFEIDKIFDLSDDDYLALQRFTHKIAKAMEQAFECNRIGMMTVGLEVPHAHIHLIPIQSEHDMLLSNPKLSFTSEEFQQIAHSIQQFL